MRTSTFLATTAAVAAVGLAFVALPRGSAPDVELPSPAAQPEDPASETRTPAIGAHQPTVPPVPVETQKQHLGPNELEGAAKSVPVASDDQRFHSPLAIHGELIVPCDDRSQPADLEDPLCVARWSVFHVAAGLVGALDAQWIEPTLLDELSTSSSGAETDVPSNVLVLDSIGRPNQVGPGRAEIEVVVERAWPSGELDHLFYRVILVRSSQGTWSVVAIGRS